MKITDKFCELVNDLYTSDPENEAVTDRHIRRVISEAKKKKGRVLNHELMKCIIHVKKQLEDQEKELITELKKELA